MYGDKAITDAYKKNALYWINQIENDLDPYRREISDPAILKNINPENKVYLDAGCGEGYLARKLVELGAQKVYALDTCSEFIDYGRRKSQGMPINYIHGDVANIPLLDNSVDEIIVNRLPNGLDNSQARYKEYYRILNPDGKLITISLHPCFYNGSTEGGINFNDYFNGRILKKKFNVNNELSPTESVQKFVSLSEHINSYLQENLRLISVQEPLPKPELLGKKWWQDNLKYPLFLLLIFKKD